MFLFSVTDTSINLQNIVLKYETYKLYNKKITIINDNFLNSDIQRTASEISFIINGLENYNQLKYFDIKFDGQSIRISKSLSAGRPLYYTVNSTGDFYCSTHITLLKQLGLEINENKKNLPEYFVFRQIMPPLTIYSDIYQLPMGATISYKSINNNFIFHNISYYKFPQKNNKLKNITKSVSELNSLLHENIDKITNDNNKFCNLLSGGIDSSTLSKILNNNFPRHDTFSTSYPFEEDALNKEKKYPITASESINTNHTHYICEPKDYYFGLIDAIYAAEEPVSHLQSVLLFLLFKNSIPIDISHIISGQGAASTYGNAGDFIFMKEKQKFKKFIKFLFTYPLKPFRKNSKIINQIYSRYNIDQCLFDITNPLHPIYKKLSYGSINWILKYYGISFTELIERRYKYVQSIGDKSLYDQWTDYSFLISEDSTMYLWSKIAEANNKNIFYPYYNDDIMEQILSIPWKMKLQKPYRTLVKKLAKINNVPDFIIDRAQSNFGLNTLELGKKDGILEPFIPLTYKFFKENDIRSLQGIDQSKTMTLWYIINYSIWKRLFIQNETPEDLKEELKSYLK